MTIGNFNNIENKFSHESAQIDELKETIEKIKKSDLDESTKEKILSMMYAELKKLEEKAE